jgi:hypothetical protein
MVKMTVEGALTLLDLQAREYRIAYAMGNGEFDVVDSFMAADDAGANAYAATYYDGDEWYVLDDTGRNINGGDQE